MTKKIKEMIEGTGLAYVDDKGNIFKVEISKRKSKDKKVLWVNTNDLRVVKVKITEVK